ncbi:hypothetical protein [Clostridioides difficile]|nr:hypothetical protein [Clostridioides difficile]
MPILKYLGFNLIPTACSVLPSRGIVVEVSPIRSLPADCPF